MKPDGFWIIGDMGALDAGHGANIKHHPLGAYLYGFSCHICLPSGMSAPNPAGLGTLGISKVLLLVILLSCFLLKTYVYTFTPQLSVYIYIYFKL